MEELTSIDILSEERENEFNITRNTWDSELFLNIDDSAITFNNDQVSLLSPDEQEETIDVAIRYPSNQSVLPLQPISPRGPPPRNIDPGFINFTVEINASDTHKRKYLYSYPLNRIYVDMKCNFSVQFTWDFTRTLQTMYVRATTVFSDESQAEKRVERCIQHVHDNANSTIAQAVVKNVLHSAREINTQGVYYCGDPKVPDSWYSVLVELTPTGVACTHAYQFVCKNSCSTGINRRAIDIIFTLEDSYGKVYGRRVVGARVCACPRRDLVRDEAEGVVRRGKKRETSRPEIITETKKIKIEATEDDEQLVSLPRLQIVGAKPMITGLEVMLSIMDQVASAKKNNQQSIDKYNQCIHELKRTIDELKKNTMSQ